MDEKERIRENLQLVANQALTRIKELAAEKQEQWDVLLEARRQLAILDPDSIEASFDIAAQRGGWD